MPKATYTVTVGNVLGSTVSTGAVLSLIPISVSNVSLSTLWSFTSGTSGATPYSPLAQGNDGNLLWHHHKRRHQRRRNDFSKSAPNGG